MLNQVVSKSLTRPALWSVEQYSATYRCCACVRKWKRFSHCNAQYGQTAPKCFDRQYPLQAGHWWPNMPVLSDEMNTA